MRFYLCSCLKIKFNKQQIILLIMQERSKTKQGVNRRGIHSYQHSEPLNTKQYQCPNCSQWQQKTKDLIWGYEQLITAKQTQIQTLNKMFYPIEFQLKKVQQKNERLSKKMEVVEVEIQKHRQQYAQSQKLIQYYKERQMSLLSQLKSAENELYNKNMLIEDQLDQKKQEDKQNYNELKRKNTQKQLRRNNSKQTALLPILRQNQSMGKLLQKSLMDVQQLGRDKLLTELKHRMTMLKAVQLTVIK